MYIQRNLVARSRNQSNVQTWPSTPSVECYKIEVIKHFAAVMRFRSTVDQRMSLETTYM